MQDKGFLVNPANSACVETSYGDAVGHFAPRSRRAAAELEAWTLRSSKKKVEWVRGAVTRTAYAVSTRDVEAVCARGDHPLGDIAKSDIADIAAARDWNSDFAFQHALHHCLESRSSVPTFTEFATYCGEDELGQVMLALPAAEAREMAIQGGATRQQAWDAVRWRIGLAYYSFIRELYAIAVLREAGIDARYHVVPDVLWRVDFWVDDLCIEMYVNNPQFKSELSGRKTRSQDWLGDGPFRFAKLELARQHKYGVAHLPLPEDLVQLTASLI